MDSKKDPDGKLRIYEDIAPTLSSTDYKESLKVAVEVQPLAYLGRNQKNYDPNYMLCLDGRQSTGLKKGQRIRRLTPIECERLQGFPDNWTQKGLNERGENVPISDTQRYKMLGNAVTVNVIEFLGKLLLEKCFDLVMKT